MTEKYDVIVVGAGPAGSVAAQKAAEGGARTVLLEKDTLPRFKLCGGGVAEWVIRTLHIPQYLLERKYTKIAFYVPPQYRAQVFPAGMHYGVSRDKFDYYLAREAVAAGVELREGVHIREVMKANNQIMGVITDTGERIYADLTIACDGVCSRTARLAGLWDQWFATRPWRLHQAFCAGVDIALDNDRIIERFGKPFHSSYLFFTGKEIAPLGYGWIFPKDGILTVGMGTYSGLLARHPMTYLDYLMKLPAAAPFLEGGKVVKRCGAYIPWSPYPAFRPTYLSGLLVAGDAAGMVSPLSGEGIFYAVKAGLEAGRTAAEAVQSHEYSAAFLARYEDRLASLYENLSYQAQLIDGTLGQILHTSDEEVHRKQYREGLIEGFMRYIGYMTKKLEIRKPVADYEMVKSYGI